jgi:hypothetical protein
MEANDVEHRRNESGALAPPFYPFIALGLWWFV